MDVLRRRCGRIFTGLVVLTRAIAFNELRQLLRFIPAVALIVPWHADPDSIYLAPAWVIAITEVYLKAPLHFGVLALRYYLQWY